MVPNELYMCHPKLRLLLFLCHIHADNVISQKNKERTKCSIVLKYFKAAQKSQALTEQGRSMGKLVTDQGQLNGVIASADDAAEANIRALRTNDSTLEDVLTELKR